MPRASFAFDATLWSSTRDTSKATSTMECDTLVMPGVPWATSFVASCSFMESMAFNNVRTSCGISSFPCALVVGCVARPLPYTTYMLHPYQIVCNFTVAVSDELQRDNEIFFNLQHVKLQYRTRITTTFTITITFTTTITMKITITLGSVQIE